MTSPTSTTRRVSQPAAGGASAQDAAVTGNLACPKCGGPMWDNRDSKRNPRAPDFRCRNRTCDRGSTGPLCRSWVGHQASGLQGTATAT